MSVNYDRDDRSLEMECNDCCDISMFYGEFNECIAEAKQEGWKIYMFDGDWCHKCPLCVDKQNYGGDPTEVFA